MTIIASVAFGNSPSIGARKSMVASAAAAVTSDAFCVRPPAARTTAVCDVPPPDGIAPNTAPARLLAPTATSSRLASTGGSPGAANARPAAIVSVKLISAIPAAAGNSCKASDRSGNVTEPIPCGMWPTIETPSASRPSAHAAAIPRPTAASGAGDRGHRRSIATRMTSVATATASVSSEVSAMCCATLSRSGKKPCLVMWVPRSLGI